ncbi:MAG: serpin family protein, partial [Proteobacteria bacterium]|nr:serpin family protein [Pseudomonadota bacterium]
MTLSRTLSLVAIATLWGCVPEEPANPGESQSSERDPRLVTELTPDMALVVESNNLFAFDAYDALAQEPGNVFFSPFSISAALGMTLTGANGNTSDEMQQAMSLQLDEAEYHEHFGALITDLGGDHGRGYELSIANRLWGQESYPFLNQFLDDTLDFYGAALEPLNFTGNPNGSRLIINDWVADQTHEKILDLLSPEMITGDTKLVLTNAIYFNADWASQFDKANTHDQLFYTASADITIPTMSLIEDFAYFADDDAQILALPYVDDELSMVVVLPNDDDGLSKLFVDTDTVDDWLDQAQVNSVDVRLPKFTIEYEVKLRPTLESLGMIDAFDELTADFSRVAEAPFGDDLFISAAIHKAYVKVDEEGTEAAA